MTEIYTLSKRPHRRSLIAGWTDFTGVSLNDLLFHLRRWHADTALAIANMQASLERISDRMEDPEQLQYIAAYVISCDETFQRYMNDFERLIFELPNEVRERHIESVNQIYESSLAEEIRCRHYHQDCVQQISHDAPVFWDVDRIHAEAWNLIVDYRDLPNFAHRLKALVGTQGNPQREPTRSAELYFEILKEIHRVGQQFERMPATYAGKHEEQLRDHFLLHLEPRFEEVTATGETFNRQGKTDILIRSEGRNLLVGECKFWAGEKSFLETITQVLGYLTWRDDKCAVILFVKNKSFSLVLQTVENAIKSHPNHVSFSNKMNDTWYNYRFHVDGDPNRVVRVAILLFHLPQ